MILSHCTHETVFDVCMRMRAIDREEIYGLRYEPNPFVLTNDVMAQANFAWVVWWEERPAAVLGAGPAHPGAWQMFAFGTDDFTKVAKGMTRFISRTMLPALFGDLNARVLYADSHENHTEAHTWLRWFGAEPVLLPGWGKDGADYLRFMLTPASWQSSTKPTS